MKPVDVFPACLLLAVPSGGCVTPSQHQQLTSRVASSEATVAELREELDGASGRIDELSESVGRAEDRLAAMEARFGPVTRGNSTYHFISRPMTWEAARAEAQGMGGDLVSIETLDENVFLTLMLREQLATERVWIGLVSDGSALWVSGAPLTESSWDRQEPNDTGPHSVLATTGLWRDIEEGELRPFIVEVTSEGTSD